jgi:hypothetical protein
VRQGHQIEASRIKYTKTTGSYTTTSFGELMNKKSPSYNSTALKHIASSLAPGSQNIYAEPYKLLIYGKGDFFKPHRDTIRGANHFASLVVFLPSSYQGGELVVRHDGKEQTYNFANQKTINWVAFFTDCEHEILPVTSGHRVTFTFNIMFGDTIPPSPPMKDTNIVAKGQQVFRDLLSDPAFQERFQSVGILLSHRYSTATLTSSKLKGKDLLIYQMLTAGVVDTKLLE